MSNPVGSRAMSTPPRPVQAGPVRSSDVLVLGAGPAGLATAWEAAERGLDVVLLERATTTGGMAASFEVDGVRVDHGSHRLHPVTPPEVLARLQRLLGEDLQRRPRRGRLRLGDGWVEFPLQPVDLARSMPPGWVARVAVDTAASTARALTRRLRRVGRARPPGPVAAEAGPSYAAVLRASLGPTVYESLYAPYARKLWGLDGTEIDAEQARVRVSADTVPKVAWRVLRSAARRRRRPRTAPSPASAPGQTSTAASGPRGSTFLYPRRGFGQITEALERAAREAGAEVQTGVAVRGLNPAGSEESAAGQVVVHSDDGRRWQAPRVFSTLPIPLLARLAHDHVPGEVAAAAQGLRFRAMVLVYLTHEPGADRPGAPRGAGRRSPTRWSAYDAHYLPAGRTPVTRVSEPMNYRDSPQDPVGRSVLCAEIPCTVGDEIWTASEERLAEVVAEALREADLPPVQGPAGAPPAVHVRRLPAVYPVYEHGFAQRLARLEAWADVVPGVTTLGRSGLFTHDNTHHALVMARAAVDAVRADGTFDAEAWRRSRETFREHVVED